MLDPVGILLLGCFRGQGINLALQAGIARKNDSLGPGDSAARLVFMHRAGWLVGWLSFMAYQPSLRTTPEIGPNITNISKEIRYYRY